MNTLDLTLRDLESLAAVGQHGHFGRAARSLRIAQPTLTAQVQKAERVLGVRLFERSTRRFQVTPEGHRVLPMVLDVLTAAANLRLAATESKGSAAPVRLGLIPTLGPYLVPHLLSQRTEGPDGPELLISEQQTEALMDALLDGRIDAALLSLPVGHDSIESVALFDESFRLIAQRGCSLLNRQRLTSGCLCAKEMVMLEEGHCLRTQVLDLCGRRREGGPRLVATSLETLKHVVASGGGYSLIPQLAADIPESLRERVEVRAFEDRRPKRRIGLCFRKSSARAEPLRALAGWIGDRLPAGVTRVG